MALILTAERQLQFKIVYWGPAMSGKTTNITAIYERLRTRAKGQLLTLNTAGERTLFFDFFPLEAGEISGFKIKYLLYTVPGQPWYRASREIVLEGADAVVFVADSQSGRLQENLESFKQLEEALKKQGRSLQDLPLVLQYNKRDCSDVVPLGTIERLVNHPFAACFEAVAVRGEGVIPTLKTAMQCTIAHFASV